MHIISIAQTALKAMGANKARTSLTVLGMVIGIASVIIVYSAGEGINSLVMGQIESFGGTDLIQTEIKVPSTKKGGASETQSATNLAQGVQVTTLKIEDMEDILELPNIKNAYAAVLGQEQASYGNELKRATIFGVSSSYLEIDKSEISSGRFFTNSEAKSLAQLAVLGIKMKEKLFGSSDPIGKSVKLRNSKFRVIGVIKERGGVMGFDFDDLIFVPVRTLQKKVMGTNHLQMILSQVHDQSKLDETAEEMRYVVRENHDLPQPTGPRESWADTGKDDFRVTTMVESMEIMETVTGAITLLLLAIVAISLVVGGVGILNIMYVVVSERTSEIGLRKAVGAKYSDIMWQFLIESIFITIAGGAIGIIVGIGISLLIFLGANSYGLDWKFIIPIKAFIVSIGFSAFFGIGFGIYPARKAAKLEPVEALRNE